LDKKSKMGAGMFDDLMGSEEESEEEIIEAKEVISVNEVKLLQHIVSSLLSSGHTCLA
jgi:hypothetical protein